MFDKPKNCTYPSCSCTMGTGCKQKKRNIEKQEKQEKEENCDNRN